MVGLKIIIIELSIFLVNQKETKSHIYNFMGKAKAIWALFQRNASSYCCSNRVD